MIKKYARVCEPVIVLKRRDECFTNKHPTVCLETCFFFLSPSVPSSIKQNEALNACRESTNKGFN